MPCTAESVRDPTFCGGASDDCLTPNLLRQCNNGSTVTTVACPSSRVTLAFLRNASVRYQDCLRHRTQRATAQPVTRRAGKAQYRLTPEHANDEEQAGLVYHSPALAPLRLRQPGLHRTLQYRLGAAASVGTVHWRAGAPPPHRRPGRPRPQAGPSLHFVYI